MSKLLINIQTLYGVQSNPRSQVLKGSDLSNLPRIDDAWLLVEGNEISGFGSMKQVPDIEKAEKVDLKNKSVLPGYCDAHTHLVFAAPRNKEFEDRIRGLSYEEIAQRGGGILNSAAMLQKMSENDLFELSKNRLSQVIKMGTTAIEIKSGYGLNLEAELKMLRVIRRLKDLHWIPIKSTLLGAHALPMEYKNRKSDFLKMVNEELLPAAHAEGLMDYVDIFCEKGYFDVGDTKLLLSKAGQLGIRGKIHVNQFNVIGGVQAGVEQNALTVDHLELMDDADIAALQNSNTIAALLPSCSFFLGIPYAPARKLLDAGLAISLASDYNPGSTPTGNMNFVWSLACIKMKLLPEEALNAMTINGAHSMELESKVGSIANGKLANLIVTKEIPDLSYIPYAFGESHIDQVMVNGEWFES